MNFEIVKAFQLRGSCNFKTENLSVENGEFSIRAVGISKMKKNKLDKIESKSLDFQPFYILDCTF